MRSRWKALQQLEPDRDYVAFVTDIPPKRRGSTNALFAGARQVRRQLGGTDGVVGFSLLARPMAKQYVTLSLWTDEAALSAFAQTEPHQRLMADLAAQMAPTTFVRWEHPGAGGRPTWDDALRRLDAARTRR
jgi:heme-degrading monooxygenase HmoA